ncbi:lactate utilization protein [Clostridiisalibacter paucivorans]|uniref:lactate utilization protein n=1 Tax=Clostridiisalibacter paucivorans TaxID=408753 RepID=UPI000478BFE9|nr:lactate utilization protein [Clostridiisalibacter paucivorans]
MSDTIKDTMDRLNKNGFNVSFFESLDDVKKKVLSEISSEDSIGFGGSMTIEQSGIYDELKNRNNEVYWHWKVAPDKRNAERINASNATIYITSTNAITEDGKLVNIDGVGNRVSSMFYGHNKVYIIAGMNKITSNLEDAIKRIKEEACPKNAERLDLNTPCRYTGVCNDCQSKDRMCNVTVIVEKCPKTIEIKILLVNEKLGF